MLRLVVRNFCPVVDTSDEDNWRDTWLDRGVYTLVRIHTSWRKMYEDWLVAQGTTKGLPESEWRRLSIQESADGQPNVALVELEFELPQELLKFLTPKITDEFRPYTSRELELSNVYATLGHRLDQKLLPGMPEYQRIKSDCTRHQLADRILAYMGYFDEIPHMPSWCFDNEIDFRDGTPIGEKFLVHKLAFLESLIEYVRKHPLNEMADS